MDYLIHMTDMGYGPSKEDEKRMLCLWHMPRQGCSLGNIPVIYPQYIRNKPTKWGFKFCVLADPTGYTLDFNVYSGQ